MLTWRRTKSLGLSILLLLCACNRRRIPTVHVGQPILRELAPGATHSYEFVITRGEVCKIRADQLGIDVLIRVVPPGNRAYEIDRWSSSASFEEVEVVSDTDAEYQLDIVSRDRDAVPGAYRLSVVECRLAKAKDWQRTSLVLEAYRHYMVGQQGRESDSPAERQAALQGYQRALPLFQQAGDTLSELTTLTYIGETLAIMNEEAAALTYYERALPSLRVVDDADCLAETLHNIGTIYYDRGEFAKALTFYDEALPKWNAAGDVRGAGATQSNIGRVFDSIGEYQKALLSYQQALLLAIKSGDKSWQAEVQHNIGMVLFVLGAANDAIQKYRSAIDISQQAHDKWSEGHMLHHLGEALLAKGELDEAERSLNSALKLSKEVGDELGRATTLLHLGQCKHAKGDHQQALVFFQEGLGIRSEKNYWLGESQALYLVGREFLDLGRINDAKASMDRALSVASSLKEPRSEAQAMAGLAEVYRRQHRLAEALLWLDRAISRVEELRTHVRQHELRALFVSTVYGYYEAARDVSMELDEKSNSIRRGERAFAYIERARARSLLDALADGSSNSRNERTPAREAHESELVERVQALSEERLLLVSRNAAPTLLRSIDRQIAEASTRLSVARADLGHPGDLAVLARATASIKAIRSRLVTRGKAFLEFSLGTQRSYVWVITSAEASVFVLPARDSIENMTHGYLNSIGTSSPITPQDIKSKPRQGVSNHPFDETTGAELSKIILGPAWHLVRDKSQLTIVPDGILHYVPFVALASPDCDQKKVPNRRCDPLLLTHEISYVPSGSVGLLLAGMPRARRLPHQRRIRMYVDPIYSTSDVRLQLSAGQRQACDVATASNRRGTAGGSEVTPGGINLRRLLYSQDEAQAVANLSPAAQLVVEVGADANLNNLLSATLEDFEIIHFATHAVADPELFQGSGIVLSLYDACGNPIPGFLHAERISGLHLTNTNIVTLSACETALGREVRGEGLMGLVYAFQRAGASSVVATLWKVDDGATAELMKYFYVGLLQRHLRPSAALRFAQTKIYLDYPAWHDPSFWAAFVFEGNNFLAPP